MISVNTLTVGVIWKPTGHFYIYAKDPEHAYLPVEELALRFFCLDTNTFYGTMCETSEVDGIPCVALSARLALDVFSVWQPNDLIQFEWEENARGILELAKIIKTALSNGNFAPDFDMWKMGKLGWKLLFPINPDAVPEEATKGSAGEIAGAPNSNIEQEWLELKSRLSYADDWLQHIFAELLTQKDSIQTAWQHVLDAYPLLQTYDHNTIFSDEDDWLIAVGWKPDQTPYRSILQLLEPTDDETWKLAVMLQDTENPAIMHSYDPAKPMAEQSFPASWYPYPDRVQKDIQTWIRLVPWLADNRHSTTIHGPAILGEISSDQAYEFLVTASDRLIEQGYTILLPAWWKEFKHIKPRLKMNVKSSVGPSQNAGFGLQQLMQFDWKLAVGDIEVSEDEFLKWFEQKSRLLKFHGHWIPLDPALLKQVRQMMKQVAKKDGLSFRDVLEMYLLQSTDVNPAMSIDSDETSEASFDTLTEDAITESETQSTTAEESQQIQLEVELNQHLLDLMQQLKHTRSIPLVPELEEFRGTLRKYQREGVTWLLFLRSLGLGGCLADDMGLGKTIQWINYLLHLYKNQEKTSPAPSLLVCPTSVLGNWQKEIARFAPSLTVYLHHGSTRKKGAEFVQAANTAEIVLTSYTLAYLDEADLNSIHWNAICLDEAQNIKNVYTKQSAAIRRFKANHRVAMTGTPMENRLTELWSIFDFINPGYLGSLRTFQTQFVNPIEKNKDPIRIEQVKRLVQPFLLRRVKNSPEIELDLPEKLESKLYVSLTVEQAALYESVIQEMFERLETLEGMERRGLILSTLMKIKQLCNHPALMLKEQGTVEWKNRSNKMERLLEMVQELRQEGDSCLIFTQFVEMGHLLQKTLENELQEPVLFLHGGTAKTIRDRMIAQFQDRSLPATEQRHIFLLSLKAGGVGLNLTAANHVFHFDRWWNPAVENQATDRAFRIGQTRHVQVYKFVTLGTLEERIDELIERKQGLNEQIVGGGENWITEMSTEDLRALFALRNEWVKND